MKKFVFFATALAMVAFSCQKDALTASDYQLNGTLTADERGGGHHGGGDHVCDSLHLDSLHVHNDSLHIHDDSLHIHDDSLHVHDDSLHIHNDSTWHGGHHGDGPHGGGGHHGHGG